MRTPGNTAAHLRNIAGNNTLTSFVSLNISGGAGPDSAYIESMAGGKLTITGGLGSDRASVVDNLFLKGNGAIDIGGPDGLYTTNIATTTLNIDKSGNGTVTTLAGTPNYYTGTTAIHDGSFIVNGTHTTAGAAAYTVDSAGTLGGSGTIGSTVNMSGTLAPGTSPGTLTLGGLTLTNATLAFELNATDHTPGSGINDLVNTGAST